MKNIANQPPSKVQSFILPLICVFVLCAIMMFADFKLVIFLAGFNLLVISFNLLVRKSIRMKPYFLCPSNIFSAKVKKAFDIEIPAELAFHKVIEVMNESNLKLVDKDEHKLEILAISKTSWQSWGENVYISVEENNGNTILHFDSAALFQMFTWGKNEDNYRQFFRKLEDSFTI